MSGASDKARFYLEQSVPELLDLRKKKIFTEVSTLIAPYTIVANSVPSKMSIQLPKSVLTLNTN